jgi:hypothetical protein
MRLLDGRGVAAPKILRGWARQDSNLGPRDYESPALTAELQAHFNKQTSTVEKEFPFDFHGALLLRSTL